MDQAAQRKVEEAFALDTADGNGPGNAAMIELATLRRWVAEWETGKVSDMLAVLQGWRATAEGKRRLAGVSVPGGGGTHIYTFEVDLTAEVEILAESARQAYQECEQSTTGPRYPK